MGSFSGFLGFRVVDFFLMVDIFVKEFFMRVMIENLWRVFKERI